MDKPKLLIMVGLQGSGKSTIAKELAKENKQLWGSTSGPYNDWGGCAMTELDAPIISSDDIRKEYPEWDNNKVFNEVYGRINLYFQRGAKYIILDATNITIKSRKQIFEKVKFDCEKVAYIVNTSYLECKYRVCKRNIDFCTEKLKEQLSEEERDLWEHNLKENQEALKEFE